MGLRVAIDTGGTFTDVVGIDEASGAQWVVKTPSTPSDPSVRAVRRLVALEGDWVTAADSDEVQKIPKGHCRLERVAETHMDACALEPRELRPGALLIKQGARAKEIFLIREGSCEVVVKKDDGSEVKVAERHAGEFVGEMGVKLKPDGDYDVLPPSDAIAPKKDARETESVSPSRSPTKRDAVVGKIVGLTTLLRVKNKWVGGRRGADVRATTPHPAFAASVMDGYALNARASAAAMRANDDGGATRRWEFEIVDDEASRAGPAKATRDALDAEIARVEEEQRAKAAAKAAAAREREKAALRATQRDLRREHAALRQDTAALTERNRALEDAATRMTMLRFGKRIDLDKMERALIPKKGIEELKVSLRETEAAHRDELRRWDADLAAVRRELTRATAENTAVLNAVSDLTQRKRELEARLKHTQSSVFVDPAAAQRREAAEREQLVAVVNAQAAEIDTLREEIGFLSVKGTPARPEF